LFTVLTASAEGFIPLSLFGKWLMSLTAKRKDKSEILCSNRIIQRHTEGNCSSIFVVGFSFCGFF